MFPLFVPSGDTPKLEPVVQKSSSPGVVQPEAPVERIESNAPIPEPCSTVEPELPFPSSMAVPTSVPPTAANKSEGPSARESPASASSPSPSVPSVRENKPPLPRPQTPSTDKTLSDAARTPAASPAPASKALNGLADPDTELDGPDHEPSPLSTPALQPQASAPACREASSSSETLPSDMRPEVPIAAALAPMAPVAVVPVTLTSSPTPALPVMLPPGLPPLVQATTETRELKPLDTKDVVPRVGTEAHDGISDSKTESQQQALTRKSPTTGTSVAFQHGY